MTTISNYLLLTISVMACVTGTVLKRVFQGKDPSSANMTRKKFNLFAFSAAFIAVALMEKVDTISAFTVVMAICFGIATFLCAELNLIALEKGPVSYTTVIILLSMVIPAFSGAIFWNETIAPIQIVGMVFMIGCLVLSVYKNESSDKKKQNLAWLAACMGAFLLTGFIGIMQKWHQSSAYKDELPAFMLISFAVTVVISVLLFLLTYRQEQKSKPAKPVNKSNLFSLILIGAVAGVCVALNNVFNLYLSGVMESAIFFPVVNGGTLLLTTVASVLLFREKLSKMQWIGMMCGIIAVLLLCNPFG